MWRRPRGVHGCEPSTDLVDEATYDMLVSRLNTEEGRAHRNKIIINELMDEKFTQFDIHIVGLPTIALK